MKREHLYWICHFGGWTALLSLAVASQSLLSGFHPSMAVATAILGTAAILLTHGLRIVIRRREWVKLPPHRLIPKVLAGTVLVSLLLTAATEAVHWISPLPGVSSEAWLGGFFLQFLNWSFITLVWCSAYFGVHFVEDLQRTRVEKWQLEAAVKEAELKALKSQLNPHFLFNSLNNLRGLIVEDPVRAQQAVTQLAGLLRYALHSGSANTVPLNEELRIVRYYLELEAIRLEERLHYEVDVEEGLNKAPVPPMLLQSLVENGIKHGVSARPQGGRLRVAVAAGDRSLSLRVNSSGQINSRNGNSGLGLKNASARLKLIYGGEASLHLANTPDDEVQVDVEIPWGAEERER